MPLSRHFYNLEEVEYALSYSITQGKKEETLFWCKELIDSGYIGETISVLFKTWLWNYGTMCLEWLISAHTLLCSEELIEDDIILSALQLASICPIQRDHSLWHILVAGTQFTSSPPDRVNKKINKKLILDSDNKLENYFIYSINQGKALCAWWAAQNISAERVWEILYSLDLPDSKNVEKYRECLNILKSYENLLGFNSENYDIIVRCQTIILFCLHPSLQVKSFRTLITEIPKEYKNLIGELGDLEGKKIRRKFQIPKSCLYGNSTRGWMKWSQNSLGELFDVEKGIIGCPFWDETLQEYATVDNSDIKWKSDELMEEFYDKFFPDDIPDEWNMKEKNMSHGDGVLGPNESVNIWKYSRNNFSKKCRLAWGQSRLSNNYLKDIVIDDCEISKIVEFYKGVKMEDIDIKLLEPCKKILRLK